MGEEGVSSGAEGASGVKRGLAVEQRESQG